MSTITVEELLKIVPSSFIIDIRSSQSYNIIGFAKTYYIYCQKGISSKKTVSILNRMGYHTFHVEGGYEEWVVKK